MYELPYPRWLFVAQHSRGRDVRPHCCEATLRRSSTLMPSWISADTRKSLGTARTRAVRELVESSEVTESPHSQHVLDRTPHESSQFDGRRYRRDVGSRCQTGSI